MLFRLSLVVSARGASVNNSVKVEPLHLYDILVYWCLRCQGWNSAILLASLPYEILSRVGDDSRRILAPDISHELFYLCLSVYTNKFFLGRQSGRLH